jgi:predicted RNase H-like nuclease
MKPGRRVTGVDAYRGGWVAVTLRDGRLTQVRAAPALAVLLTDPGAAGLNATVAVDMPLGLLAAGWRTCDRAAARLLGPRRSSVFAIPPRPVWEQDSYPVANALCKQLTGNGMSAQAYGLRARLLEADAYRQTCGFPLHEVHPELAFAAMAGAPLADSKHTPAGRARRRELLAGQGICLPEPAPAPLTDTLDAAAVAWSAHRIATGTARTVPSDGQTDEHGRRITISY